MAGSAFSSEARRPIAMKKEGIQTRNRKITPRRGKKKCHVSSSPEENNSHKECVAYGAIQQCNSVASYSDQESTGNMYNPQAVATTPNFSYNNFSSMPQAGYGFHAYQQSMVGSIS